MRWTIFTLTALLLGGAGCSYFHDGFPGASCNTGMDCFKGNEKCDTTTHLCVPNFDAAPVPDAPPVPDAGPDADLPDADVDADLPDADVDADIDGGALPDVGL